MPPVVFCLRAARLTVAGKAPPPGDERRMLYRGIAGRAFERRFVLADHIVVQGASLENGLLHVALRREVPEALKPRRIQIAAANSQRALPTNGAQTAQAA